jgi:uncharacterized membrane protein required for colicin V production
LAIITESIEFSKNQIATTGAGVVAIAICVGFFTFHIEPV